MESFYYEEPSIKRKEEALEYIKEHRKYKSNINGSGSLYRYMDNYEGWLLKLEKDKSRTPSEEGVPTLTYFLIRKADDKIVGMVNIRLCLNERLKRCGGHIGYGIRPTERRKGYNKINLYLALEVCAEHGIEEVYLDCERKNVASSKTMKALGGTMIDSYYDYQYRDRVERYKINVSESLEKYRDNYEQNIKNMR